MSISILFCYSHEDEVFLNKLKTHLMPLQRQGLIALWCDRNISAGTVWEQEISNHLGTAQIILLLVSSYFLASDYCYGTEMKRAIERHERGEVRVIPVILRRAMWKETPLSKLQALPKDGKPITEDRRSSNHASLYDVAEGVRKVIEELNSKLSIPLPTILPEPEPVLDTQKRDLNIIDAAVEVARKIGADKHPVSLADLHTAYLHANPDIKKGSTRNSFDATINYHCINMRSRFPDPRNKQKSASWLSRPLFKRVARACYMLLSPDEISLFHQRVKEDDPRIYEDEYNVEDLTIAKSEKERDESLLNTAKELAFKYRKLSMQLLKQDLNISELQSEQILKTLQRHKIIDNNHDLSIQENEIKQQNSRQSKYVPLALWLQNQPLDIKSVSLSIEDIERLLGTTLPSTAHTRSSFWSNNLERNPQARQWCKAGWEVSSVSMSGRKILFSRIENTSHSP